jgi:apolipoprotein N-acyltransferase
VILSLGTSAFFMSVALGSADCAWLAWVSLLPLFWSIRKLSPLGATFSGMLWGIALYGFSVSGTVPGIAPSPWSLLLLATVAATYAGLGALLTHRVGFSPFVLAVGWIGVEFALRPLTLRNGLMCGTQGNGTLVQWVGGLFGYVIVAFLVAYVNASLLAMLGGARFTTGLQRSSGAFSDAAACRAARQNLGLLLVAIREYRPRAPPIEVS